MSDSNSVRMLRWKWWLVGAVAAVAVLVPTAVLASHSAVDVPDDDWAHDDIAWMYDTGLTNGCSADMYCPDGNVTRREMAAFTHRVVNLMHGGRVDVPAAAFVPESDATGDYFRSLGLGVDVSSSGAQVFIAPLTLPRGATITEIRMLALDDQVATSTDVVISRVDKTDVVYGSDYVGGIPGTDDHETPTWYSSTVFSEPLVDTNQYWYSVLTTIGPGNVLYGVEIYFTMP